MLRPGPGAWSASVALDRADNRARAITSIILLASITPRAASSRLDPPAASFSGRDDCRLHAAVASAPLTRVSRTHEGLVLETGGTVVRVVMRFWPMPLGRGWRWRCVCPKCGTFRDVLHWRGEWGCRGKDCLDLEHACRHELRWCPAVRRRAKLLRKLARYSPRGLKARVLRAQIARQEAAMLANMKRANRDLTKRVKRHGGRQRANSGQ